MEEMLVKMGGTLVIGLLVICGVLIIYILFRSLFDHSEEPDVIQEPHYKTKKLKPQINKTNHSQSSGYGGISDKARQQAEFESLPSEMQHWFSQAWEAEDNGDEDRTRFCFQKVSYGTTSNTLTQYQKQMIKEEITGFVQTDSKYQKYIKPLQQVIKENEGIMQSKLYTKLGLNSEQDKEAIRYIAYFADELGDIKRVKKGRSYELYSSDTSNTTNVTISTTISKPNNVEQKIIDLNGRATELKKTDINKAIECLKEAQELNKKTGDYHYVQSYVRLPQFLQQADRLQEAEQEFEYILKRAKYACDFYYIYDKMRLAYQRSKKNDLLIKYLIISGYWGYICNQKRLDEYLAYNKKYDQKLYKELMKRRNTEKSFGDYVVTLEKTLNKIHSNNSEIILSGFTNGFKQLYLNKLDKLIGFANPDSKKLVPVVLELEKSNQKQLNHSTNMLDG